MLQQANHLLLPTPEQMGKIDRLAAQIIPVITLMENAGLAVAKTIMQFYKPCKTIILCGPGNNGGDGYVTARLLAQKGWPVKIMALHPPRPHSNAAKVASQWAGDYVSCDIENIKNAELVIDAVFGAGLSRDLDDQVTTLLKAAKRIVSIDMPSGVDGATGMIRGYAPHAELTITFFRAKPGHYLLPGREYIGKLVVKDIGIPESILSDISIQCWLNEPGLWTIPVSKTEDYKYHRGIVNVIGGGEITGAARLSSLAALSCGAGLVHIFALGSKDIYLLTSPCFMVDSLDLQASLADERRKVWVCGPGLVNQEVQKVLPELIKSKKTIVADAGALQKEHLNLLNQVEVITPHIGEFTHVFGKINTSRLSAAQEAAKMINTIVVLKGPDTIIAAPDGRVAINCHANARLATAGSGDVLSGIIATFLACGMESWEAACAGVWVHGEAAYLQSNSWPNALDLIKKLGQARDNAQN